MRNPKASKRNPDTGQDQTEGHYFPSTLIPSARFAALFWNNGLNNAAWFVCPYVNRKQVEKDTLLVCFASK